MGRKIKAVKPRKIINKNSVDSKKRPPVGAKAKKASAVKKAKPDKPAQVVELPSVENDKTLKQLSEKTAEAERLADRAEAVASEAEPPTKKVKVKRKEPLIKKEKGDTDTAEPTNSKEKTFISLDSDTTTQNTDNNKENALDREKILALRRRRRARKNCAVVYLSHVPHGFYEKQMKDFFEQFGTVTNLRIGRSAKSGKSKGYAFIEFKYLEVAKIVAETMNNYLMFNKILKCEIIPKEKTGPRIFRDKINPRKPPPAVLKRRAAKKALNSVKGEETMKNACERRDKKLSKIQKKLEEVGVNYSVDVC